MSCPNFEMQDNFPLFATSIFDGYYDDEEGEYFDGDIYLLRKCEAEIENFNRELEFYSIKLQDGYCSGVQVILKEPAGDYCVEISSNYTAEQWRQNRKWDYYKYYFKYPYSEQKRKEEAEIKRIIKYCREFLKEKYDFAEYGIAARFSNGETWYSKVG